MKNLPNKRKSGVVPNIIMALVYLFLYTPMIVMLLFSFNSTKSTAVFNGFSLKWYEEVFSGSSTLLVCLKNSLILAVASSAISTVLGTLAAVGVYNLKSKKTSNALLTVRVVYRSSLDGSAMPRG